MTPVAALPTHRSTSSWAPVDVAAVLAAERSTLLPRALCRADGRPLLYAGKVHTVSGESESLKSWLLLLAVAQEVAGGRHALWLDFEDNPEDVVDRLLALGCERSALVARFHYVRPDAPLRNDDGGVDALRPVMLSNPTLAVIDGATEAMSTYGLDPNANADVATFYRRLPRLLAAGGPAVVLIDHVTKNSETRGRYAIGAQHKLSGIDGAAFIVELVQPFGHGQHGIARVDVAKDRPGRVRQHAAGKRVAELHLYSEEDGGVRPELLPPSGLDADTGAFRPTVLMQRISLALVQAGEAGLSGNALEKAVSGKASAVRIGRDLLVEEGYITATKDLRGTTYRHLIPYAAEQAVA